MMVNLKSVPITKEQVWHAYLKVKKNGKTAGVDELDMEEFEKDKSNHLYKLWNRMASGSYLPPAVRRVSIPKKDGGTRMLGIPTISDRIGQMVIKELLEAKLEALFHANSYGYRPAKNAHQAVKLAQERCWDKPWVIDLDIKGFFDNIDHELLMKALCKHVKEKWMLMYIQRWLKAPVDKGGQLGTPLKGSPQGGVISPLLANLFLHYTFDMWIVKHCPTIEFERYADDIIVHCCTLKQAQYVFKKIETRLNDCQLELHKGKSKIVYCKQATRAGKFENHSFDFLGFTFKPTQVRTKEGKLSLSFLPAISQKAKTSINDKIRKLKFHRWSNRELGDIAKCINPMLRGWINYYGRYSKYQMTSVMLFVNRRLLKWACNRYKRFRGNKNKTYQWLKAVYQNYNYLFVHWQHSFAPHL